MGMTILDQITGPLKYLASDSGQYQILQKIMQGTVFIWNRLHVFEFALQGFRCLHKLHLKHLSLTLGSSEVLNTIAEQMQLPFKYLPSPSTSTCTKLPRSSHYKTVQHSGSSVGIFKPFSFLQGPIW